MRFLDKLRLRLRSLFRRREVESELDAELRFHLEQLTEENISAGMRPNDARDAARRTMGGIAQYQEECRDLRRVHLVEDLVHDLRYAVRSLAKHPGFTTTVVVTLALGLGANTAIFAIVYGVLLRPLDYPNPSQLMALTAEAPLTGLTHGALSAPEYVEFRRINHSFATVGAYSTGGAAYTTGEVNLTVGDRPLRVRSVSVDGPLLRTLGIAPERGRLFSDEETSRWTGTLAPPIAMLSHELWESAFQGGALVGQKIEIEGRPHEIVGILPSAADVMDIHAQVWLPLWLHPSMAQQRSAHVLHVIGRLNNGVKARAAQTELTALLKSWSGGGGAEHALTDHPVRAVDHSLHLNPLQQEMVEHVRRPLWVLQAAVGFVLLIVCANLVNLMLARAGSRQREFALRTALGASRARLLRQVITEGALMSGAGGLLGLWFAHAIVRTLIRAFPDSVPGMSHLAVGVPAWLAAAGLWVATSLLFGGVSLGRVRNQAMAAALKEGTKGSSSAWRHYARRGLVVAQVAFAVILVIGAGLLVETVYHLTRVDAGFDRSRLVTFSMTLPMANSDADTRAQAFHTVLERLRSVPGVLGAVAMSGLPPNRTPDAISTPIENYTSDDGRRAEVIDYYQFVMGDYFSTMGIPLVAGRGFERTGTPSQGKVAVVNEALARKLWPGQDPIGRRVRPAGGSFGAGEDAWHTVIGVAKDVKQRGLDRSAGTELYVSLDQHGVAPPSMNVVMRTTLPPAALAGTVERVVREADPAVPVARLRDMDAVFAESIRRPRLLADILGAFAVVALLLAAIGTYGVLSFMVAERRREIGIRVALGAARSQVLGQIMKQGLQVTAAGLAGGLAGALAVNRLMASLLFGVQPADLPTIAAVIAIMASVAVAASWLPAWRASRLDPNLVLRDE